MTARFFTFVAEFRGTTNVSQVFAGDEEKAVELWTQKLGTERPFGRASAYLAKSSFNELGSVRANAPPGKD
jgi:hypothetical protein